MYIQASISLWNKFGHQTFLSDAYDQSYLRHLQQWPTVTTNKGDGNIPQFLNCPLSILKGRINETGETGRPRVRLRQSEITQKNVHELQTADVTESAFRKLKRLREMF